MLVNTPVPYRPRRGRIKNAIRPVPPGAALTLVGASWDENENILTLTFDRAIDAAGLEGGGGAAITVRDGINNSAMYNGVSLVTVVNPSTVALTMVPAGPYAIEELTLTATAASGIVAVNDGGTWPGLTNVDLPYP